MIDGAEAVKLAGEYFNQVYKNSSLKEVLLEEVELTEDGKQWIVIYGFDWQPESGTVSIGPGDRKHKIIKLDSETGMVLSMKIANINA